MMGRKIFLTYNVFSQPLLYRAWRAVSRTAVISLIALAFAVIAKPTNSKAGDVLAVFGDSLVSGYGVLRSESFPAQLERQLAEIGLEVKVINLGVPGDTSYLLRNRVMWSLSDEVTAVFVEIGGNDALRAISPSSTKDNLDSVLSQLTDLGLPVFLSGMKAPVNLGPEYAGEFDSLFQELAEKFNLAFDEYFLAGVTDDRALRQRDQIHPTAEAITMMAKRLAPLVAEFLQKSAR